MTAQERVDTGWAKYNAEDHIGCLGHAALSIAESGSIDLLHLAGMSLLQLRRVDEGLMLMKAAVALQPMAQHIYLNCAAICEAMGMTDQAVYFSEAGLRAFPSDPGLLLIRANCHITNLQFEPAIATYLHLLGSDPDHIQSMINLGNIARARDDFKKAELWFQRAAIIDPDFRDLKFARATMYTQQGEDERAIAILEKIPEDPDAQFLLSLLYLARGDLERGFELHRARHQSIWGRSHNRPDLRRFDHWTEAKGKKIAVIQEGGLGDMIQFSRYLPQLAEIADITLFTPPAIGRLMTQLPVKVETSYGNFRSEAYEFVTSDVEMPYHFRTTMETIPEPFTLTVPSDILDRHRMPPTTLKRVGLCWAGGTRDDINRRSYDDRRSFDLRTYAPLGAVPDIEFVSLQMGQRADQERMDLPLTHVLRPSFDLLDTAAVIMQLDLVISVDTSIAHLAAALGKPVWLLSRYDCCWRWFKNREASPWYPTVRVFGQKKYKDWSGPIAAVVESLKQLDH